MNRIRVNGCALQIFFMAYPFAKPPRRGRRSQSMRAWRRALTFDAFILVLKTGIATAVAKGSSMRFHAGDAFSFSANSFCSFLILGSITRRQYV